MSGNDEPQFVHPYDKVAAMDISLADDVGVDLAELDTPLSRGGGLRGGRPRGPRRAARGKHLFQLADKAHEGDLVQYQVKGANNRRCRSQPRAAGGLLSARVPRAGQTAVAGLAVARKAEPAKKQDILAQRSDISKRIDAIQKKLTEERSHVANADRDTRNQAGLTPEQNKDMDALRKENRGVVDELNDLAKVAAETPGLDPLRQKADEIARGEMQRSDDGLQQAAKDSKPEVRHFQLQRSDKELEAAQKRLDEMRKQNDQLAQPRMDQMNLKALASRQQQLADRTGEQATKDPIKDPESPKKSGELQRNQAELAKDATAARELTRATRWCEADRGGQDG